MNHIRIILRRIIHNLDNSLCLCFPTTIVVSYETGGTYCRRANVLRVSGGIWAANILKSYTMLFTGSDVAPTNKITDLSRLPSWLRVILTADDRYHGYSAKYFQFISRWEGGVQKYCRYQSLNRFTATLIR